MYLSFHLHAVLTFLNEFFEVPGQKSVDFFIDIGRGVVYDYSCKKLQTWLHYVFLWSFLLRAAGDPPHRDAPGAKSYIYNWGSNMAKMIEGDLRIPKNV